MRYRGFICSAATALLLLTVFIQPSRAGWVEQDRYTGTMYISERGLIKNVPSGRRTVWTIMDFQRGEVTMVNPRSRTYTVIRPENFCAEISAIRNSMLAGMPPKKRAIMERMMGSAKDKPAPRVRITRKEPGGVIAGYETTKYSVRVNGWAYKYVWLAPKAPVMKDMHRFLARSTQMNAQMQACTALGPASEGPPPEGSKAYLDLALRGWIMKEENIDKNRVEKEVITLKKKNLTPSDFRVPAAYRKISIREMMGGMR